ncbi:MAG TPA: hypothetical protein VKE41_02355 [Roseiflexaceae bacterium]|nr:hypothetical protein [Roseiflexaceae bacterium]
MHPSRFPRSLQTLLTIALLIVTAIVLSACGTSTPAASTAAPKTPVSIQLVWTHEYSSASFYAAEKNGHFAAQNLDVRLEAGGFGPNGYIEPTAQVVNGKGTSVSLELPVLSRLVQTVSQWLASQRFSSAAPWRSCHSLIQISKIIGKPTCFLG